MARRRRGNCVKTTRQGKKIKKGGKVNGLLSVEDGSPEDSFGLLDPNSGNGVNDALGCIIIGEGNCIGESTGTDPIVHHKKFGKIRVSHKSGNSLDAELLTEGGKDYVNHNSKSSDNNESESLDNNKISDEVNMIDLLRGIERSGQRNKNSYSDFRKQSSVYNVENDIPLDGSVIIKPGTFSSNTITSSVKPNLFFDNRNTSEINSVNFLKVLQGIEMLERNVSGSSIDFEQNSQKSEKNFSINASPCFTPVYLNEESEGDLCKVMYSEEESQLDVVKREGVEFNELNIRISEDLKIEENKKKNIGSLSDDASSDIQIETDETARKLQGIILNDYGEVTESPGMKNSYEPTEKKTSGFRNRTESTDTAGSESGLNCGTTIRRSDRIKSIGILKQKEKEQAAVRMETVIKSPLLSGSPAITPPVPGYEEKPVKVKSRWRRSSELEMHCGKTGDSESLSSNCTSPVNLPPSVSSGNLEVTQEDLEKLEKEKKDIEEGLKSFNLLTENEYKMERSACKETKRMICDCVLSKEEIMRGEVGCGEDCLNKMLFLECGSRCALGDRCTNKRFQKLQYANCKIFKTEKKGFGLRAEEDLAGNTFIMEYVGEVVNQKEFARRVKMYAKENNKHFYFMALKGDAIIDATNKGNISRFINHSCDPNAETQKWTINGELRVGFFTRRFVAAGEEITFDYQFQRYGKQAQKCYCEAPSCRGWIGENPDESIDDEEEEEEEEEDEEDEEEEEEEEEDDLKKGFQKVNKIEDDKEKKEDIKSLKPVARKVKKESRRMKEKKERKTTIVDDMGLDEEIQKLFQTGLKNRAHTLTLSRLMVRAEDWSTRGKLLKLIREGETPCRRLFLDYHGLRLICSWMLSRELEESNDKNERRLEILKTLSKLPIPNRNMLIDSKILSIVEQWSKSVSVVRKLSVDEELGTDDTKKPQTGDTIPGLGGEIEDVQTKGATFSEETIKIEKTEDNEESVESVDKVKRMAEAVLESWSSLKEVFKIPKKERIEQMKEHERQADRGYSEYLDNKENFRDKYDRHDRYGRSDRYRDRDRERIRDRKRVRESPDPDWFRNSERRSKMTKHERRQLFALKVLQEDEEAKKRNEHLEMWKQHESRCLALGLDPNLNAACDPQTGFPIFFDHNSGTWQNCPPSSGPSPSMPNPVTPSMCPSPMYSVGPPMIHNCPMCPNLPLCSNINNPMCHNAGMLPNNQLCSNVSVAPCQGQPYSNILPPYQGSTTPSGYEKMVPYQDSIPPENEEFSYEDTSTSDQTRPLITEVPLNVPIKLPPKWKAAKDPKGRVYYYHIKERVSQWEPPQWTEEDAKIEAAKTVALEMGDESSSSTESSTDSSSEEEYEEVENLDRVNNEAKVAEDSQRLTNGENITESNAKEIESKNSEENATKGKTCSSTAELKNHAFEEEKDEDLSAWEGEDEVASSKAADTKAFTPNDVKPASSGITVPIIQPAKGKRAGLVQEIMISPRREEDRVDNRKYKEVKEMLRRQKEEARAKEKMRMKGDKESIRLSRSKKKRKEKGGRSNRLKMDKSLLAGDSATDKKIKENFKNSMAGAIVSHLNPYRKQDCKIGRITCNEDFKHLARKLTHFVMLKELKHCKGVDDLECNDSVKAKAKDFIRKYMAKFGAVYQRPQHEVWKT